MKRLIHRARRGGKTTEAVKLAIQTGAYLIVPNRNEALRLSKEFPELRFPITWNEFLQSRMQGSFVRKVVIDNLDQCIQQMFPFTIEAVTMSTPLDRKNPNLSDDEIEKYRKASALSDAEFRRQFMGICDDPRTPAAKDEG